jgi:parvulin-like peptidyl-prolyl isomerase
VLNPRSPLAGFLREPLVHFLAIGVAVFALYALAGGGEPGNTRIVVSDGRVQQLVEVFSRTWQRPPTQEELRALIDAYVREEIYYREAVKLGFDRDDTLIRRRMQQKMEFLSEAPESALAASDDELAAYLEANREAFRVAPQIAFRQVFINPKRGEIPALERARQILALLSAANPGEEAEALGDATLLPPEIPLSSLERVSRNFGEDFARQLIGLPRAQWAGPLRSSYGLHLIYVTDFREGYDPPLADIRDAVDKQLRTIRRDEYLREEYEKLRSKYEVVLPPAALPSRPGTGGGA